MDLSSKVGVKRIGLLIGEIHSFNNRHHVKIAESRLCVFLFFSLILIFFSIYFSSFLFLELWG